MDYTNFFYWTRVVQTLPTNYNDTDIMIMNISHNPLGENITQYLVSQSHLNAGYFIHHLYKIYYYQGFIIIITTTYCNPNR